MSKENKTLLETNSSETDLGRLQSRVSLKILDFIGWLRNNRQTVYRCDQCGYYQGHQIIYCPKCSGKMQYKKNETLEQAFRYDAINNQSYYKYRFLEVSGIHYLTTDQWAETVELIKRDKNFSG